MVAWKKWSATPVASSGRGRIAQGTEHFFHAGHRIQEGTGQHQSTTYPEHVVQQNLVYLHVDGSWINRINMMGFGGVLRNVKGDWISGLSGSFDYGNSFLAELLAIEQGLSHA